jgi:perosamine synthetase
MKPTIEVPDVPGLMVKLEEVLKSGWLTHGVWNSRFEDQTKIMAGSHYAVSCGSGTAGLELVFRALPRKGIVIIPTNTHFATAIAAVNAGHKVLFRDVDPSNMMLAVDDKTMITHYAGEDVVAIVYVSIGGFISQDILKLRDFCDTTGIHLIEDAAHAHGVRISTWQVAPGNAGRKLETQFGGSIGHAGVFSYYPTKVAFGAEGGCIVTKDRGLYEKLIRLRDIGRQNPGWLDQYAYAGFNGRMSNVNACICHHVQSFLPQMIAERTRYADYYGDFFEERNEPVFCENCIPNYYKVIVICETPLQAERLKGLLKSNGTPAQMDVFAFGLHEQPYFMLSPYANGWVNFTDTFPVSDHVTKSHVCLPISAKFDEEKAASVCNVLREWDRIREI